jgi:Ran GTPase-activating protein (RanGAP) involved in mRNA processing and transport
MNIDDVLLIHVCEYLRGKISSSSNGTFCFDMLKFVKNAITDEGLSALLGYLIETDSETQVLNLTSNLLTPKCLSLIEELGHKNRFLKTVYLSHNKISAFQLKTKLKVFESLGIDVII